MANVDILLNLISEYRFDHASKAESVSQWKRSQDLAKTRNLLVHNPPIENFEFLSRGGSDISAGFTVGQKVEEIIHLSLPIGEPGSGLSLEEISDKCLLLRRILSKLEALHDDIVVREL